MRRHWGLLASALCGAVWGFSWMVVVGTTHALATGHFGAPAAGAAALAGAACALAYVLWPKGLHVQGPLIGAFTVMVLVLMVASGGHALELPLSETPLTQAPAIAFAALFTVFSARFCLDGVRVLAINRYNLELILVRSLKGLGLLLFTVLVALPFIAMLVTSMKSQQQLLADPLDYSIDLSAGPGTIFRSYVELFTDFEFGTFLLNSAIVSVATVIVTVMLAVPGAYAVARLRFPGQAFLSNSILLIYMVPAIVLVIPLYAVFSQLGLRNSLLGLMIVYPATTIPVALYMLQGYFRGLPSELEEAGLMDGLRRLGVITKITLPLSLPALASVGLYVFMIAWNEFLFAFMFLDDVQIFTLSRGVVSLNTSEVPRQHLMAGAVVATIPILAVFLACERFMVSGLTAGSVKG